MRVVLFISICIVLSACTSQPVANSSDDKHIAKNTDAAEINIQLGANYIANGEYQLADDKLQKAFKQDPKSSVARWTYAILQEKLNQNTAAEHYYKEALSINPKDSRGQQSYASFLCRNNRYPEASKHFKSALADPLLARREYTSLTAGVCAMEIPDYQAAESYLQETLRVNKTNRVALYQLAKLNFKRADYAQSQSYMRDFEEASEHTAKSLWLAYQIEHELGNARIAQSYAELLAKKFPASTEAQQLAKVN